MPKSQEYLEYVLEQLERFSGVTAKRMFSGFGLYQHDVFFGLVFSDTLYFKVNDQNRPDYESRGMRRFQPYKDKPHLSFTYYEVPVEVLENREDLTLWASRSVQAAVATALEKQAKRRKPKTKRPKAQKRAKAPRSKLPRAKPDGAAPKRRASRTKP
jgi:DNA transformation protein and related proteins